jgi:methylmalonyl-CoA mutase cobalamin-binding subunit
LSEVAPFVGGGATADRVQTAATDTEAIAAQLVGRVLAASADLDPIALQDKLEVAASFIGLARCIDEIVLPAARELRERVATGQFDATQGITATEAIRTWLNHRGLFAPAPRAIGPILLACGPRDRHQVGLESLALLLRFQRWPCRVLGARTSRFTLTVAAKAADAAGVVVMSGDGRARPQAVDSLRAVDAMDIPVFYGGDAFDTERGRREVPGRYLGAGAATACTLLIESLSPADS